jgi:hypothetical protein
MSVKKQKSRDESPVREVKKDVGAVLLFIEELAEDCLSYIIPPSELTPEMFNVFKFWTTVDNLHDNFDSEGVWFNRHKLPPTFDAVATKCYKLLFGDRQNDTKESPPPAWEQYLHKKGQQSNPFPAEHYRISTYC